MIRKDEMTPKERMIAYTTGKPYDRMPCTPMVSTAFIKELGFRIPDYYHDPDTMTQVAIESYRAAPTDNVSFGAILQGVSQGYGSTFTFSENNMPILTGNAITDYDQLDSLREVDVLKGTINTVTMESLKRVIDAIGDEVSIGTSVAGPFTTAAFVIGTEKMLKDMNKNPEKVHELLRITTVGVKQYIKAVSELGIRPSICEPVASCTMISPRQFRAFAKPYLTECMDYMKSFHSKGSTIHICGKSKPIWDDLIEIGSSAISLDNQESMAEIKASHGDRICIIGNIDPVAVIKDGSRELIEEDVKHCIDVSRNSPKGFILSSGCGIPLGTKIEKINMMLDATRKYGRCE